MDFPSLISKDYIEFSYHFLKTQRGYDCGIDVATEKIAQISVTGKRTNEDTTLYQVIFSTG